MRFAIGHAILNIFEEHQFWPFSKKNWRKSLKKVCTREIRTLDLAYSTLTRHGTCVLPLAMRFCVYAKRCFSAEPFFILTTFSKVHSFFNRTFISYPCHISHGSMAHAFSHWPCDTKYFWGTLILTIQQKKFNKKFARARFEPPTLRTIIWRLYHWATLTTIKLITKLPYKPKL